MEITRITDAEKQILVADDYFILDNQDPSYNWSRNRKNIKLSLQEGNYLVSKDKNENLMKQFEVGDRVYIMELNRESNRPIKK